jgi:hypothetical protein
VKDSRVGTALEHRSEPLTLPPHHPNDSCPNDSCPNASCSKDGARDAPISTEKPVVHIDQLAWWDIEEYHRNLRNRFRRANKKEREILLVEMEAYANQREDVVETYERQYISIVFGYENWIDDQILAHQLTKIKVKLAQARKVGATEKVAKIEALVTEIVGIIDYKKANIGLREERFRARNNELLYAQDLQRRAEGDARRTAYRIESDLRVEEYRQAHMQAQRGQHLVAGLGNGLAAAGNFLFGFVGGFIAASKL